MSHSAELDRLIRHRRREKRPILVGLDGRSGAGKSTIAAELAERHGGAVILADDFYAGGSDDEWISLSSGSPSFADDGWGARFSAACAAVGRWRREVRGRGPDPDL